MMSNIPSKIFQTIEENLGKFGGPFGAAIADKDGNIISLEINRVIELNDPTAHAEIQAIRKACKELGTYDLSGYDLYTSCFPCPMCISAACWSNIKNIYYAGTSEDAEDIGFKDADIYDYLNGINLEGYPNLYPDEGNRKQCQKVFQKYKKIKGVIY